MPILDIDWHLFRMHWHAFIRFAVREWWPPGKEDTEIILKSRKDSFCPSVGAIKITAIAADSQCLSTIDSIAIVTVWRRNENIYQLHILEAYKNRKVQTPNSRVAACMQSIFIYAWVWVLGIYSVFFSCQFDFISQWLIFFFHLNVKRASILWIELCIYFTLSSDCQFMVG